MSAHSLDVAEAVRAEAAVAAALRLAAASGAVVAAARALSHGMRREGVPRATETALRAALDRAVDAYEAVA